ncbi:MAG TPA: hypothetical protein VMU84_17565, partial [Thermoanaerobaculia bacterium]|nr:hypothetical protein [Thermoanaerobaculia bacterium]
RNIVGPNEVSAKASFEWGPQNLSTFISTYENCGEKTIKDNAKQCFDDLQKYAKDAAVDRIALSVEYHRTNRRWIDLTDPSIEFGIPRAETFVGSLTYGRPLSANPVAANSARFDVKVEYEDNSEKGIDNRLTGSAIVTWKVNDAVSVPLGIVFANHQNDLPDSDRELSAHFGLIYKLPKLPTLLP